MRATKLEMRIVAIETQLSLMSKKLDALSKQMKKFKAQNVIEFPIKDSTITTIGGSTITTSGDTTEKD